MILYPWAIFIMLNDSLVKKLEAIHEDLISLADHSESMSDGNIASGIANELDALIQELVEASNEDEKPALEPRLYKGTIEADLGYNPEDGERVQEFVAYFTSRSRAKKETHEKARKIKNSGYYDSVKESVTEGKEGDWI